MHRINYWIYYCREARVGLYPQSNPTLTCTSSWKVEPETRRIHHPAAESQIYPKACFFIFFRAALSGRRQLTAASHQAHQQQRHWIPAERLLKENASGEDGIYSNFLSLLSLWYRRQPLENVIILQHGETQGLQKLWMCVFRMELIELIGEWGLQWNDKRSLKIRGSSVLASVWWPKR